MRKLAVLLVVGLVLAGCTPIERTAYNTVVGAKAFLDTERKAHPECVAGNTTTLCVDIAKAVAAKDLLIDAITVYCSGPDFNNGGACNAPSKGSSAYTEEVAKLQAAINNYNQVAKDLQAVK